MATKVIKLQNDSYTLLPITDASLVQMSVDGATKSVQDAILENEEVTAAGYNELNNRLTSVENSYVKSIATSGSGTYISGVTLGNDSNGGKKLTFSYGTIASDTFIAHVTATIDDYDTLESDGYCSTTLTWTETYETINAAVSAGKTVIARCTVTGNNNGFITSFTVDLDLENTYDLWFSGVYKCVSLPQPDYGDSCYYIVVGIASDDAIISGIIKLLQDALISGTNIKTINDTSLLGDGNIDLVTPSYLTSYYYDKDETDELLLPSYAEVKYGKPLIGSDPGVAVTLYNCDTIEEAEYITYVSRNINLVDANFRDKKYLNTGTYNYSPAGSLNTTISELYFVNENAIVTYSIRTQDAAPSPLITTSWNKKDIEKLTSYVINADYTEFDDSWAKNL